MHVRRLRCRWWWVLLLSIGLLQSAHAGLRVFFLRHAEGGHNVVGEWKDKPKEQWPAYVGNANMFTPRGEAQIAGATTNLKRYSFDFIAVSPVWRARHTVLPFVRDTRATAEVWPELEEYSRFPTNAESGIALPPPGTNLFAGSGSISVPNSEKAFFSIRADGQRHYRLSKEPLQFDADAAAVAARTAALIRNRFGGSNKSILLVGHDHNGRLLLHTLLGRTDTGERELTNAALWMVEQQADGRFKLRLLNDQLVNP